MELLKICLAAQFLYSARVFNIAKTPNDDESRTCPDNDWSTAKGGCVVSSNFSHLMSNTFFNEKCLTECTMCITRLATCVLFLVFCGYLAGILQLPLMIASPTPFACLF